jgi:hypothetical protein
MFTHTLAVCMLQALCQGNSPMLVAEPSTPEQYWYYCDPARAYFPSVSSCPVPWRKVLPTQSAAPVPSVQNELSAGSPCRTLVDAISKWVTQRANYSISGSRSFDYLRDEHSMWSSVLGVDVDNGQLTEVNTRVRWASNCISTLDHTANAAEPGGMTYPDWTAASVEVAQLQKFVATKNAQAKEQQGIITFLSSWIGEPESEFSAGHPELTCNPGGAEADPQYQGLLACGNVLAVSDQPELMDDIAGIKGTVAYKFDAQRKLFYISGDIPVASYSGLRKRFIEKWGQPDKRELVTVRNALGVEFEDEEIQWMKGTVEIVLRQYNDGLGDSDEYNMGVSEFWVRDVPTDQALRDTTKGKL